MPSHPSDAENFAILDTSIPNDEDYQLAIKYAPRIRFDVREPFLPSVVGYTIFRETAESPSFPRKIDVSDDVAFVIEYAVWWDWDIGHLYELEHIWVYVNHDGDIVAGDASWHGGQHPMVDESGQMPMEEGRLTVHSESGKHAFAPSNQWLLERKDTTIASCGSNAGKMGVHVTPLFKHIIRDKHPLNDRLVHTYCERRRFEPSFEFEQRFDLETAIFVPWNNLFEWIPHRVHWWTKELANTIQPHKRRGLRIAHRGASAYAQENSAEALHKAAELGSDMVELDIRSTKDDVPVAAHDPSLKRLYGVDVNIQDVTFAELQTLTQPHPILSFEETVKTCRSLGMSIYLDIKDLSWAAAESVFESLEKHHLLKYSIFGSFRPDYLAEIKAQRPDAVTSVLFNSIHVDPVALAQSIQADYVHPCWEKRAEQPHKLLTPDWIGQVREAGLGIICWHEERPEEIKALWNLGVDGICSDTPERLLQ